MVTLKQLRKIYGKRVDEKYLIEKRDLINKYGEVFKIENTKQLARFLSQTKHEIYINRDGSVRIRENLNYKRKQLKRFSKFFRNNPVELEKAMSLKGEEKQKYIATMWYGTGEKAKVLGNTKSIHGWKYRGSGDLQITGRYNTVKVYEIIEKLTDVKCFDEKGEVYPEIMNSYKGSILSAMGFWYLTKMYNCTSTACIIKKINSGLPKKEKKERLATTIHTLGILTAYA